MITIDQLLESVDLDFEPRFVTKDKSGIITIWADKPSKDFASNTWIEQTDFVVIHLIKLADFENKDWQECIYEVPQEVDYTKYIGKVCKFWDGNSKERNYGILTKTDGGPLYPFECNEEIEYEHCEPVRPDDDVIYKGE